MVFRYLTIFLALLILFNGVALDYILIFATPKIEIHQQLSDVSEREELEYPCQAHSCGCTKESCLISCCCYDNHEEFYKLKAIQKSKNSSLVLKKSLKLSQVYSQQTSIIKSMICKHEKLKENDRILFNKDMMISSRFCQVVLDAKEKFFTIKSICSYSKMKTQIT